MEWAQLSGPSCPALCFRPDSSCADFPENAVGHGIQGQVRADLVRISAPALQPQAVTTHTPLHSLNLQMQSEYLLCRTKESPGAHKGRLKEGVICRDELPGFPQTHMGLPGPAQQAYRATRGPTGVCVCALEISSCGPASSTCVCTCVCTSVCVRVCVRVCMYVCAHAHPWNATAAPLNLMGSKFGVFALILAAWLSYCVFIFLSPFRDCLPPRKV